MVGDQQVVVDRLGHVEDLQVVLLALGDLVDDVGGLGRVVAADVEEVPHVVLAERLEDLLAVFLVRLVARGAQGRGGRAGDDLQHLGRLALQVDEVVVDHAAHAVARAEQLLDLRVLLDLLDHADQRLVDDHRRPARLPDDRVALQDCHVPDSVTFVP